MFVVEVIPLGRGSVSSSLTYYSSVAYDIGTIITVPVRTREVRALVINNTLVSKAKTAVRAATFSLKKLPEQKQIRPLPPILIEAAVQLSKLIPASIGSILYTLLPEEIRSGEEKLESNLPCIGVYETPAVSVLQATEAERMRVYRSRIREAFAHRGSVLFVVPTSVDVATAEEYLSQGIEDRIVTFSSSLTPKKRERAYAAFHDLSTAKLIITTPSHCFLDRHDITHIIIDQSNSQFYKARVRPYLDYKEVLRVTAKLSGRQIITGDILPASEDEYRRREDQYATESEHPKRIAFSGTFTIIKQTDKPKPDQAFELYSPKLITAIDDTLRERKNAFLYAARRGIAPIVACVDCGHIFRCPDSGTPYSLLRTTRDGEEHRWFLSSTSGKKVKAADVCPNCGSWRLKERGVGIQHMYDELRTLMPKRDIFLFDHTTATTKNKALRLIHDFYDCKGAILLGTSMVLPYLEKSISLTAIPSLDAARALPTWRAEESFYGLLLRLREKTADQMLVQTRSEIDEVLTYAKTGQVEQFYNDELELREALDYPPFTVFVHLTFAGPRDSVMNMETNLQETLGAWGPQFYEAPYPERQYTRYGLIRIPHEHWPSEELIELLKTIPPSVRIEINPVKIV